MGTVVALAAGQAKKPQTKRVSSFTSPDARLIKECVRFVQASAAFFAGYEADPDGNKEFAERLGHEWLYRSILSMRKIAKMRATSAEGLQSKARVALTLLERRSEFIMGEDEMAFLENFARDTKKWLTPAVTQQWRKRLDAEREASK